MQSYGLGLIELSYLSLKIDKQEIFIYEKSTESCTKTHLWVILFAKGKVILSTITSLSTKQQTKYPLAEKIPH